MRRSQQIRSSPPCLFHSICLINLWAGSTKRMLRRFLGDQCGMNDHIYHVVSEFPVYMACAHHHTPTDNRSRKLEKLRLTQRRRQQFTLQRSAMSAYRHSAHAPRRNGTSSIQTRMATWMAKRCWRVVGAGCRLVQVLSDVVQVLALAEWVWTSFRPGKKISAATRLLEATKILRRADKNGNGRVDKAEFQAYYDAVAADSSRSPACLCGTVVGHVMEHCIHAGVPSDETPWRAWFRQHLFLVDFTRRMRPRPSPLAAAPSR